MLLAGSNDKILCFFLLEHEPLHFYIIFRMSPVAQGIKVAEVEAILKLMCDEKITLQIR